MDAFPTPQEFAIFLSARLNKSFVHYAPANQTYRRQLFVLLKNANAEAWIAELVLAALEVSPHNPKLQEFSQNHGFGSA
jgi:hypothetical protein